MPDIHCWTQFSGRLFFTHPSHCTCRLQGAVYWLSRRSHFLHLWGCRQFCGRIFFFFWFALSVGEKSVWISKLAAMFSPKIEENHWNFSLKIGSSRFFPHKCRKDVLEIVKFNIPCFELGWVKTNRCSMNMCLNYVFLKSDFVTKIQIKEVVKIYGYLAVPDALHSNFAAPSKAVHLNFAFPSNSVHSNLWPPLIEPPPINFDHSTRFAP